MHDIESKRREAEYSRRGAIRADVNISVLIRQRGYSYFKAHLTDVSETGFRIASAIRFEMDSIVYLKIPGLESLESQVRWHSDGEYGCRFEKALYPAVFDHIVRYISEQTEAA